MDTRNTASGSNNSSSSSISSRAYFEQQREVLVGDIAQSFEQVLSSINKLNRSLEAVIAVGNEFSSVEALWSQFENVMAKDEDSGNKAAAEHQGDETQAEEEEETRHE
ncbi:DASH complex subunit Dad1 domain-containing protein [Trichoderma sp. SZMC 28014]